MYQAGGGEPFVMIMIKKGLDLPIGGVPDQVVENAFSPGTVAVIGPDYVGMRPSMAVKVGDRVKVGQPLFEDKKNPGIGFTSPASGTVTAINRGERRAFQSLVIAVKGQDAVRFSSYTGRHVETLQTDDVRKLLLESGAWTSFRTRPFSRTPAPDAIPHAIFVTAIDTNPLAPRVETVLSNNSTIFEQGLRVLKKLTPGKLYLCIAPGSQIAGTNLSDIHTEEFSGPHPAGLAGTHIHFLDPVSADNTVWYIGYQDVAAIGHLFKTGAIFTERIISLAGPQVKRPRLLKTRVGACVSDLIKGELKDGKNRMISGSVLHGRTAEGPYDYLGYFHNQVTVLLAGAERKLLGWAFRGYDKFSFTATLLSRFIRHGEFAFTTSTYGSRRPLVSVESFEKVMPLDIQPFFLLRALLTKDTEQAQALGCLELDEEDLALLSFVSPSKHDFGSVLRETLMQIEKEGL